MYIQGKGKETIPLEYKIQGCDQRKKEVMYMTKKEMFAQVIAMAKGEEVTATADEVVAFAEHEIELLSRKSSGSGKPTKNQIENEGYKQSILEILAENDHPMTISDLMEDSRLEGLKNQRVSAIVTQLKNAHLVKREVNKKKAYFHIPTEDEEEKA